MLERKTYTAKNQGTNITPHTTEVKVVWIDQDRDSVHYQIIGQTEYKTTSIARFKEIVGVE